MQESDIIDAEFEEVNEEQVNVGTPGHIDHATAGLEKLALAEAVQDLETIQTPVGPEQQTKLSKQEIVKALKGAVEDGAITKQRARQVREEMGIFQTDFTGKKISDAKRKAKRKAQKAARKKQRK